MRVSIYPGRVFRREASQCSLGAVISRCVRTQYFRDLDRYARVSGRENSPREWQTGEVGARAGLCSCFSNFRFGMQKTGSTIGEDRFAEREIGDCLAAGK